MERNEDENRKSVKTNLNRKTKKDGDMQPERTVKFLYLLDLKQQNNITQKTRWRSSGSLRPVGTGINSTAAGSELHADTPFHSDVTSLLSPSRRHLRSTAEREIERPEMR